MFRLDFGGYEHWLTRRRVLGLLVVPAFVFGLVMTGAFFQEVRYIWIDGAPVRDIVFSNWLNLNFVYSYGLFGIGFFLILRALARAPYLRRRQSAALILATLVPLLFNLGYLTHLLPITQDLTPVTFAFSGIVLSVGVMRYRVIDLTPVARGAVADHTRDGILVVDLAGRIADLNPAAQRYLGLRLPEDLGRPLTSLLPALQECLDDEQKRCEFTLTPPAADNQVHLEGTVTLLFVHSRLPAGYLIVLHDITARKQVETTLQSTLKHERELAELKTRFYAYFAHQLRTPLSVIVSSAELLEYYGQDWSPERRRGHFERIYQAVRHLTQLSERAATFEKNERRLAHSAGPLRLERFDLREFVARTADEAQSVDANRHAIVIEAEEPLLPIAQDTELLHDVVENIISNALKFSPEGSPVQITLATTPLEFSIRVQDHGCGIPAEELDSVLQPFYRASNVTNISGTGLGLAIASHYVAHLGGQLRLDSQLNLGTTVSITLPRELKT